MGTVLPPSGYKATDEAHTGRGGGEVGERRLPHEIPPLFGSPLSPCEDKVSLYELFFLMF